MEAKHVTPLEAFSSATCMPIDKNCSNYTLLSGSSRETPKSPIYSDQLHLPKLNDRAWSLREEDIDHGTFLQYPWPYDARMKLFDSIMPSSGSLKHRQNEVIWDISSDTRGSSGEYLA